MRELVTFDKRQVGQRVSKNCRPVAGDVAVIQQQVDQWRGQEDEPRNGVEKMRHRVEVAKPLRESKPRRKERIVGAQDLDHAARPADALADVRREPLGGQAGRLRNVDVGGAPSGHLHAQRSVRIFSDRLHCDAADLVERGAAQHRAGAAEERCIPEIVAVLHDAVEQLALVGNHAELLQIALERIGRIEMVRRLQHGQLAVAQKPAHRHLQKAARGHVVGVEDGHEGRVNGRKRRVDVARLGVFVVGRASCSRYRPQPRTARTPCGVRRRGCRRAACRSASPC